LAHIYSNIYSNKFGTKQHQNHQSLLKHFFTVLFETQHACVCSLPTFPVAAAWNTLPVDVQSSPSLPVFRQRLKTFLFHESFPDVV